MFYALVRDSGLQCQLFFATIIGKGVDYTRDIAFNVQCRILLI